MDQALIILGVCLIAGFYMAWSIGANDVSNAMGTSVGSHALTIGQAIGVAAIFEFMGAFLVGGQVTNTIKQEIVDPMMFTADPIGFAGGMTAALLATAVWLQIASAKGLPVSTTHSIVGAVVGFGIVTGGWDAVQWDALTGIVLSWFISPLLGGVIAFATFFIIRKYILDSHDPLRMTKKLGPYMLLVVVTATSFLFFEKALSGFKWIYREELAFLLTISFSAILAFIAKILLLWSKVEPLDRDANLAHVERIFAWFQIVTACFMALAHGSNDVSNAIGPVAAVASIVKNGYMTSSSEVPLWLLGLGGIGIVVGLATYGRKVIETIGTGITEITPTRGFSAEFGASFTILVGSSLGLPLSTTQVLVGAVIGIGLARGISGLNIVIIKKIMGSWLITIPTTGCVSAMLCYIWQFIR
jgi:inorganic phosphate transporter, PiT family